MFLTSLPCSNSLPSSVWKARLVMHKAERIWRNSLKPDHPHPGLGPFTQINHMYTLACTQISTLADDVRRKLNTSNSKEKTMIEVVQ